MGDEIDGYRAAALATLSNAVLLARATYVTDLAGQDMVYLEKRAEADRFLADPKADAKAYPLIMAEIGITGGTASEVCQVWKARVDAWIGIAAIIEGARLAGEAAIKAAVGADAIDDALHAADATLKAVTR